MNYKKLLVLKEIEQMKRKTQQELNKKHFEMYLGHLVKELGYEHYQIELEENIYNLVLKNENFSIFFDDFNFIEPYFLHFFMKGNKTFTLWKKEISSENPIKSHIKEEFNKKKLKENKEKISKLIQINKKISITAIATELGMTRQALYKNLELKNLIDELKNFNKKSL